MNHRDRRRLALQLLWATLLFAPLFPAFAQPSSTPTSSQPSPTKRPPDTTPISIVLLGRNPKQPEQPPPFPCKISLQIDNDAFIFDTDRGYTQGLELHTSGCFLTNASESLTKLLLGKHARMIHSAMGWTLGQHIYTPEDVYTPRLVIDDRPYAGWLFLTVSYLLKSSFWKLTTRFTVGLTGEQTGAGQIQTGWHRMLRLVDGYTPDVEGWNNQLPNEVHGQLGMDLALDLFALEQTKGSARIRNLDLVIKTSADMGTALVRLSLGSALRVGQIIKTPISTSPSHHGHIPFELYGYINAGMHFVFHNIFVSGALWTRSHGVPIQNFVFESELGLFMRFGAFFLGFAGVFRGREGHYQNAPLGGHRFFRIQLGYETK